MARIIISHESATYKRTWEKMNEKDNGAYWYSREICEGIIPRVKTERPWVTINMNCQAEDHAIVFIHNNKQPGIYTALGRYKDLVLVCGIPETVEKVKHLGRAIYLPLSINTEEVLRHQRPKTKWTAYIGRKSKGAPFTFPPGTEYIADLPRAEFLDKIAEFQRVYAVGRCALEAKCLGAKILPYDPRFPDPGRWQVLDTKDAAEILQKKLDEMGG